MKRTLYVLLAAALSATRAGAQDPATAADSALVRSILVAEDRRDSTDAALARGMASANPQVSLIARRALARMRDPRFASRDSLPPMPAPAPPTYSEPAWRLRYRALAAARDDCVAMREALGDSAWHVRLRAADLVAPACARDTIIVATLHGWLRRISAVRTAGGAAWQPAAHAIVALARIAAPEARAALPRLARHESPWLRTYAARAAGILGDTAVLRSLARDGNDNVKEAAIGALAKAVEGGHAADVVYLAALSAPGYQAVRAAAVALKGSPRGEELRRAALAAAQRLRADSSETARDARAEVMARLAEVARTDDAAAVAALAGETRPARADLSDDAVALALGADVRLRITMSPASGGGTFVARLRGDVAPIMGSRVLALVRARYYDGLTWHRVEPDFVIQGGSRGDNEYVGYPRFLRDELGTVPHIRGTVGMSTRGHDTGDAQWFVNLKDNLRLGRDYTVFAEVVDGMEVVDGILEGDRIERIEIVRGAPDARGE
jgi:cyclophilin family peptidyl-prolyl cis-trans isomerase